jgi:diguanylate cyclase (GGDEF)-like protein
MARGRSAYSRGIRRVAAGGLAFTMLALTALSLIGVASTRRSADTVARSSALADAYARANKAVSQEESLERKYRLARSSAARYDHAVAGAALHSALTKVDRAGKAEDRELVQRLRIRHREYDNAVLEVFAAVDIGDNALAAKINDTQVDPIFAEISSTIQHAAETHTQVSAAAVSSLHRMETLVFYLNFAGFAIGLCLVTVLAIVVYRHQKALLRQSMRNEYEALHDALTGLPNRTLFAERIDQALATLPEAAGGRSVTVMLLDLDRFKEVNDTLGHHYGDELLKQVAARLAAAMRETDTVARLSGDEFALLLPGVDQPTAAERAHDVLHALHQSFTLLDVSVDIEASIGVAIAPRHASNPQDLMRCADLAMYNAKDAKAGVVVYEAATQTRQPNRISLLGDIRRALEQPDELVLHYQPKIDLAEDRVCGVEALIRWAHPSRGLLPPIEFLPVVENTSLVRLLTTHALRTAIAQAGAWLNEGLRLPVAVNLSARCLVDPDLVTITRDLLDQAGLCPSMLRMEVTESAVMANPALAQQILTDLHRLGVRLSIDDYGTGYSSMAYVKRLPVDELKIDRSFVLGMTHDDNDAILVRSAVDLGHNLGLTVVAEGVERADHVLALRRLGCDTAQGYHYARPMPAAELTAWVRSRAGSPLPQDDPAAAATW